MLMLGHIEINRLALGQSYPFNRSFQKLLPDHLAGKKILSDLLRSTAGLAEIPLCVRYLRAGVNGIPQFLIGELHTGNVNRSEPVKFLLVIAGADIDHQLIVEDLLLLCRCQTMEIAIVDWKVAADILAQADCALLSVQQLVIAAAVIAPVHDIQRKAFHEGIEDGIALLLPVDKFTLERRSDLQFPAVAGHAVLCTILMQLLCIVAPFL